MTALQKLKKLTALAEVKRWLATPDDLPFDLNPAELKMREQMLRKDLSHEGVSAELLALPHEEIAMAVFNAILQAKKLRGGA